MAKRRRKKPEPDKPRDPYVVLFYALAGVLGVVMLAIIALIAFEKIPDKDRVTALGGLAGLASGATTAAGIAANRSSIKNENAKQVEQFKDVTNKQTEDLKDHASGTLGMVKDAYAEWAKWKGSSGGGSSAPVSFTPDPESEANKKARAEWRQQQTPPT